MANLETTYLGLPLISPIVVSASPLSETVSNIRQMEQAGAGAVVLHSLFEEEILAKQASAAKKHTPYAAIQELNLMGPDGYLAYISRVKEVVEMPVIANLNGITTDGWVEYAGMIELAGADALELNIYYVSSDPDVTGEEVEENYLSLVTAVKSATTLPISVKISPYFSAISNMAKKLEETGADGLVIFNRFYQPDIDIESMRVIPDLDLSTSSEMRLRLRWASILSTFLKTDLAITGGVHTAKDVMKCIMVGAKAAMMTSALLEHGIDYIKSVNEQLANCLHAMGLSSISEIWGVMRQDKVKDPAAFERANYMRVLKSY
ncbi:MAG: dihydroorotate dehydrogenase-like protein [Candidatus Thermofonsia bacterium]|nr:MAG: dihydroorotate dehydrogenase-like protein [Candidatus Thermofonsia bacterium]